MKIKLLLGAIIAAASLSGANAGSYCPPAKDCAKCPVDCCEELQGNVGVSYMSDYIFRGVRYSRDAVGLNASYRFDNCVAPVTIGVNHISSLGSNTVSELNAYAPGANGDQTDVFVAVGLPSICGFDFGLRYDHYMYPNARIANNAVLGDSHGALGLTVSREVFCGLVLAFNSTHDFNQPSAGTWNQFGTVPSTDNGAWIHTASVSKSFCITDCISLNLTGGVLYTDNLWNNNGANHTAGNVRSSGWNSYYVEASLPISIGKCATLSPYVAYNGTPDGWVADGVQGLGELGGDPNANDVFNGGIRLNVGF
jgi:hypothetical protein